MRTASRLPVVLVGAGNTGRALAVRLSASGLRPAVIVSRRASSAREAARLASVRRTATDLSGLPLEGSLILLSVPDRSVRDVVGRLAMLPCVDWRRVTVLHTSGVLTSDVLAPLRKRGAACGSLHPLQTFPRETSRADILRRTHRLTYGIEGDARALRVLGRLVGRLGGAALRIPKEGKIPYHLACTIASNYTVVLIGLMEDLLRAARIPARPDAWKRLVETSVVQAFAVGAGRALTGPIVRGDAETVVRHRSILKPSPGMDACYRTLGLEALALALRTGRLAAADAAAMRRALGGAPSVRGTGGKQ